LACLASAGCESEAPRYEVTGTVTFEGAPIEEGSISFVPEEKGLSPDAGRIEKGRYSIEVRPGRKQVQIRASRPLPPERQDPHSEMGPLYEDYIPAQYNSQTTLSAEVTADGKNEFSFDLKQE
jgi:hypothetical protein